MIKPPGGFAWPEMPIFDQSNGTKVTFKLDDSKKEDKVQVFKIASAEDSDSIFEDMSNNEQIKKLKAVADDYDSEGYGDEMGEGEYSFEDDEYCGEQENKPQKLPLETILEEDSILKKPTPDQKKVSEKLPKKKIVKSRSGSRERRIQSAKPLSRPAPSRSKWPEMSGAEKKVAEADAYLNMMKGLEKDIGHVKFKQSVYTKDLERQLDMSQMSAWTGDDGARRERPKTSKGRDLSMPREPEQMAETILTLRNEKNILAEQVKLLKTTVFRLKKQIVTLEDTISNSVPDFIKYNDPCSTQPNDVEGLLNALSRFKRQN